MNTEARPGQRLVENAAIVAFVSAMVALFLAFGVRVSGAGNIDRDDVRLRVLGIAEWRFTLFPDAFYVVGDVWGWSIVLSLVTSLISCITYAVGKRRQRRMQLARIRSAVASDAIPPKTED